jgi:hypothetical protein
MELMSRSEMKKAPQLRGTDFPVFFHMLSVAGLQLSLCAFNMFSLN